MSTQVIATLNRLGPRLLYAGAAVGVSHLVMSTRAGASFEFLFLLLIPLIHFVKYPFYKFGPQYTALKGRNILHGYYSLGKWALIAYTGMTIKNVYQAILAVAVTGTIIIFLVIKNVPGAMGLIVTIATVVSFVSAPVIAYINYKVMHSNTINKADRPGSLMTL